MKEVTKIEAEKKIRNFEFFFQAQVSRDLFRKTFLIRKIRLLKVSPNLFGLI